MENEIGKSSKYDYTPEERDKFIEESRNETFNAERVSRVKD